MDYHNRIALVTGGASGIGRATATLLRSLGATVVTFDVNATAETENTEHVVVDVTQHQQIADAVATVGNRYGRIDLLVNNAGIGAIGSVEDGELADWQKVFDVNVFGLANVTRAALPFLRKSSSGAIVNLASLAAMVGLINRACYSASKGAVFSLTLAMAADLIKDGIRVNGVAPGTIDTPWVGRLLDAAPDPVAERVNLVNRQPVGRLGSAEEIAAVIAFLGCDDASFVNGAIWPIDGGMSGLRIPAAAPQAH